MELPGVPKMDNDEGGSGSSGENDKMTTMIWTEHFIMCNTLL